MDISKELRYIKNEIIAQQKNGKYCKWSRPLKAITVTNFTKEDYLRYWMSCLKDSSRAENKPRLTKENKEELKQAINEKFDNLISIIKTKAFVVCYN